MLRGQARRVRPRHRLDRRLHVQGRGPGRHLVAARRIKPASGFDGLSQMDLVRNPNAAPDSVPPQLRRRGPASSPTRTRRTSTTRSRRARSTRAISSIPSQVGAKYNTDPNLKKYLHINAGDRIWYLTMNLTQAPFDDVHVRKAMNWIMDKAALQQAWGGAYLGPIANHDHPGRRVLEPARRLQAVRHPW